MGFKIFGRDSRTKERSQFHHEVKTDGKQLQYVKGRPLCTCGRQGLCSPHPCHSWALSHQIWSSHHCQRQHVASSLLFLPNLALAPPIGKNHQDPANKSPLSRPQYIENASDQIRSWIPINNSWHTLSYFSGIM